MNPELYLDHNATTPLLPEVRDHMLRVLEEAWGNPSSLHAAGRAARGAIEEARESLAALLRVRHDEVVFTSGGTEADHLALRGAMYSEGAGGRRHLVVSSFEHPAVLECCRRLEEEGFEVTRVDPDGEGVVRPEFVAAALRSDTALVSVMAANNEVGTVQPVAELAALAHTRGALFHSDAVQALGKLSEVRPGAWGVDLASFSAHKIGGPKGAGALYVRRGLKLRAQQLGGPQERQLRGGTENTAAIAGFGMAARLCAEQASAEIPRLEGLRDRLASALRERIPDLVVNGGGASRLCNTLSVTFPGCPADLMVMALDMRGIAVSAGSACASGSVKRSQVILAMGKGPDAAAHSLRFSLGRGNTEAALPGIVEAVAETAAAVRTA